MKRVSLNSKKVLIAAVASMLLVSSAALAQDASMIGAATQVAQVVSQQNSQNLINISGLLNRGFTPMDSSGRPLANQAGAGPGSSGALTYQAPVLPPDLNSPFDGKKFTLDQLGQIPAAPVISFIGTPSVYDGTTFGNKNGVIYNEDNLVDPGVELGAAFGSLRPALPF